MQKSTPAGTKAGKSTGADAVPQYPIESVDNALKLLLLLGEQPSIRLTEASKYLGVATSTAHRVLAMLQYRGFVRQDTSTKAYGPGPALTGVAFSVIASMDIHRMARPLMQDLNDTFNESIHLGVLEGSNIRFLEAIESRKAVRVASRMGKSLPAHCTSLGKAVLAQVDEDEFARLYPSADLTTVTDKSIGDRDTLERELAKVRKAGYATNREESEEGVASVAVAVPTRTPGLRLGLSLSAPVGRMPQSTMPAVVKGLQTSAAELGELLG